jgi:hypothetical protein
MQDKALTSGFCTLKIVCCGRKETKAFYSSLKKDKDSS